MLPIAICVVMALAALVSAAGDPHGGKVISYIGLACGAFWAIDLICLVVIQALNSLPGNDHSGHSDSSG